MHYKIIILTFAALLSSSINAIHAIEADKDVSADKGQVCEEHKFKSGLAGSSSQRIKVFHPGEITPEEESRQNDMQAALTQMRDETWDDRYRY